MAKKVTAPKTYNPGNGHPQEHLAYLNQREMAYLRSMNGGNTSRGPKGLPSFVETSGTKDAGSISSSYKGGGGGWNTSNATRSGNTSGVGGGGGGGGGSTGSRGSSTGSVGAGNGSNAGSGQGGQGSGLRGAGSNYGPGSGRPGTTSSSGGGNKGPASPMGGQGTSMSRDTKARQEAQVRDAIAAVKNTPAFRSDASSGGIRSINVGPMGTPVNVGPKATTTAAQKQFYERIAPGPSPSTSISSQFPSYKYDSPLKPGMTTEDMTRRGAMMNQIESEIRDIMRGTPTRTGDPLSAGGVPPNGPNEALKGTGYGAFNAPKAYRDELGFEVPSGFSSELPEPKIPDRVNVDDVYGPVQERVLAVEDVQPEVTPKQAMKNAYSSIPSAMFSKVKGIGSIYSPEDEFYQSARIPSWKQSMPTPSTPATANNMTTEEMVQALRPSGKTRGIGADVQPETDVYGPKNVSQEVQQEMADIDKLNKRGITGMKSIPVLGNVVKAGDALRGLITGKNTAEADADLKRAYMQGSSAQKAELEAKYPNLTKFAQQAGLEPKLPMSNYESWRQKSFGFGGSGTGTSTVGGGSTDRSDIGSGGKAEPIRPEAKSKDTAPKTKKTEPKSGSRPEIYYMWDAGVNIPSSGDSDYTLYQQYLAERRAAQAAFGMR